MDAAFHLEINEFRGRRSVQLTICDVQLSDCEHLADQKILNLYNTLMQDGPLTAREARLLLPDRKDLVAVWRHVTCRAGGRTLSVPDGALSRRVAWESRRDINIGKLFVCLDVFQSPDSSVIISRKACSTFCSNPTRQGRYFRIGCPCHIAKHGGVTRMGEGSMQTKLDFLIERVQKQNPQANIKKIRAAYECAAKHMRDRSAATVSRISFTALCGNYSGRSGA